jgi:hypothetical protein
MKLPRIHTRLLLTAPKRKGRRIRTIAIPIAHLGEAAAHRRLDERGLAL